MHDVVWWSLVVGGLVGGVCRSLLAAQIELPYWKKMKSSGQVVIVPGFVGDLGLGMAAAFVLMGASSSTASFRTAYSANGFWAPFISSIIAGVGAAQLLQAQVKQRLESLEKNLTERVEEQFKD